MYYQLEISTNLSGTPAKAVYDRPTLDAATMAHHQAMASAMANENVKSILGMIIDEHGAIMRSEYWERETAEETAEEG